LKAQKDNTFVSAAVQNCKLIGPSDSMSVTRSRSVCLYARHKSAWGFNTECHKFLTSSREGSELLASRSGTLIPAKKKPCFYCKRGWVGSLASLGALEILRKRRVDRFWVRPYVRK